MARVNGSISLLNGRQETGGVFTKFRKCDGFYPTLFLLINVRIEMPNVNCELLQLLWTHNMPAESVKNAICSYSEKAAVDILSHLRLGYFFMI